MSNYTQYLGAKRCCDLKSSGDQGAQGATGITIVGLTGAQGPQCYQGPADGYQGRHFQ